MTINPFAQQIETLDCERRSAEIDIDHWQTQLAWFKAFDFDGSDIELKRLRRLKTATQAKLQQARQTLAAADASVKQLAPAADLGFDPRYWFSSERAVAKRRLEGAKQELAAFQTNAKDIEIDMSKAMEASSRLETEMDNARKFDPLLAQSAIPALQARLKHIAEQSSELRQRRDDLDVVLREPLEALRQEEHRHATLAATIHRAESFEHELNHAANGFERRQVHERCERELGDGRPSHVLRRSQGEIRGIDDRLRKLRARIERLVRVAQQDIRHIVIDGNNLCYEGRQFVGLAPLEALVPALAQTYDVTLIFDASIRRKLGLGDAEAASRFPQSVTVHVVASRSQADETVLAVADSNPRAFVLSNDRFVDYPDKMAVKQQRVLRHEIVGQTVHVHDLHLAVMFS
ncbi:NYN domain-containing protein [Comamonas sp. UBA7528]|uniref:NYN domain-containing protein n=1 Tax=Comamonas sp. UBA7528 TaxID=1946391 RepID=UPI0025C421A4|nr:hypothetical protein [Comamonas sp. UBA7528]